MANILRKNMYLCFSKIKCLPTTLSPPQTNDDDEEDDGDSDNVLKSYNSLFTSNSDQDLHTNSSSEFSDEPENTDITPDFSSIFASRRFFFSSPGTSNSIVDSPGTAPAPEVVPGGVAIQTYSPDPYADFRRSMEEMVESKGLKDMRGDNWKLLHELLMCYLSLNPKHTHKYIIGAFTDLIVELMSQSGRKSDDGHRHCRSSSEPPLAL